MKDENAVIETETEIATEIGTEIKIGKADQEEIR